jgi:ribosomal-protein-alanine N-acetyltransferase
MIILETKRLVLRKLVQSDFAELYELYRDPEIRKFFPEGVLTEAQTQEELSWYLNGGWSEHPELGLWATILKESGRFVGRCGLIPWQIDGNVEVEVAYLIAKSHWRQGLGSEAAIALVDYGLNRLGFDHIIALIDSANEASIRTAARAGLSFDREQLVEGVLCPVYSIWKKADTFLTNLVGS